MPVPRVPLETRDDDERTLGADHRHHVAQDLVRAPFLQRFVQSLRESIVHRGSEVLGIEPVVTAGQEQFLCPDQTQCVKELRAERVVAGLAACEGEQGYVGSVPPAEKRQHPSVLIVRMGGRVHRARCSAQFAELVPRVGRAVLFRKTRQANGGRLGG